MVGFSGGCRCLPMALRKEGPETDYRSTRNVGNDHLYHGLPERRKRYWVFYRGHRQPIQYALREEIALYEVPAHDPLDGIVRTASTPELIPESTVGT